MIRAAFASAIALCLAPLSAQADFVVVQDKQEFLGLLAGKDLRDPLLGITISVLPDGTIEGSAVRWGLTGTWDWQNGAFCREMDWSGMAIEYNCQLVEIDGNRMRFTVDRGAGDSATFTLR